MNECRVEGCTMGNGPHSIHTISTQSALRKRFASGRAHPRNLLNDADAERDALRLKVADLEVKVAVLDGAYQVKCHDVDTLKGKLSVETAKVADAPKVAKALTESIVSWTLYGKSNDRPQYIRGQCVGAIVGETSFDIEGATADGKRITIKLDPGVLKPGAILPGEGFVIAQAGTALRSPETPQLEAEVERLRATMAELRKERDLAVEDRRIVTANLSSALVERDASRASCKEWQGKCSALEHERDRAVRSEKLTCESIAEIIRQRDVTASNLHKMQIERDNARRDRDVARHGADIAGKALADIKASVVTVLP